MGKCYNIKFHVNLSEIFKPINQIHFTNDIITVPAKKCILILSWSFFPVTTFGARNVWKIPKLLWSFSTKRFGHNQFFLISGQSYKDSMIVIYDSRVVPNLKIPHITTLDLLITIVNCLKDWPLFLLFIGCEVFTPSALIYLDIAQ